jgi:acyl carrier protein
MLAEMGFPVKEFTDDVALGPNGVGMDSLAPLELYLRIEEEFGVMLDQSLFTRLTDMTVGELLHEVVR